ncbi:MAG: GYD domain-containing protein [Paracoccaceae bacterium]|jgi:uncharacterized protein with GYD domain|nr:GYD domain-containing protein [Paracoccaceae bacterium]|tara:strand:- start:26 stop:346 length:321 start_codon:yes stop_codon:yes gene_type:complete
MPRFYMMGTYSADGMKGIVGGSDRAAAVDAVVKAVGGSLNHFSFTRGEHDIIVDVEAPSVASMMGVMAAVRASGSFESVSYLECIDMAPVVSEAQTISASYKPANS